MQSEIDVILKYGGILFAILFNYFTVIRAQSVFAERQNVSKKLIDINTDKIDSMDTRLTIIETEHKNNLCDIRKKK
jgi:hypothetical protein